MEQAHELQLADTRVETQEEKMSGDKKEKVICHAARGRQLACLLSDP